MIFLLNYYKLLLPSGDQGEYKGGPVDQHAESSRTKSQHPLKTGQAELCHVVPVADGDRADHGEQVEDQLERLGQRGVEGDELEVVLVQGVDHEHLPPSQAGQQTVGEDGKRAENTLGGKTKSKRALLFLRVGQIAEGGDR